MSDPSNPYASPLTDVAEDAPDLVPDEAAGYRSTQGLGRLLRTCFWIFFASVATSIPVGFWYIATVGQTFNSPDLGAAELATVAVAIVTVLSFLTCVVLYCKWKYRGCKNLRAFGETDLLCSPGWAVGFYFVPIVNLFRPYQAMKELYNGSAGDALTEGSRLVTAWWIAYLVMNLFDRIASTAATNLNSVASAQQTTAFEMWSSVVTLVATLIVIRLTAAVDSRQLDRGRSLGLEAPAE